MKETRSTMDILMDAAAVPLAKPYDDMSKRFEDRSFIDHLCEILVCVALTARSLFRVAQSAWRAVKR